jgi:hypothetical protein
MYIIIILGISRRQQILLKDSPSIHQQETKKAEKKSELLRTIKVNKSFQDLDIRNTEVSFDSNKNCSKNMEKVLNGAKLTKKLNLDNDQIDDRTMVKQGKQINKLTNGLLLGKNKRLKSKSIVKTIEIVEIEDDEHNSEYLYTSDPLALTPKLESRSLSPELETAMENIAERIKRRKTTRMGNMENTESAFNLVSK